MKLVYPMMNVEMVFEENTVNSLIVENQKMFYETVSDLYYQTEGLKGQLVLSENYEPIEIRKYTELITQFVPFTLNKKDILTKLYADIQRYSLSADMIERTHSILAELERYISDLSDNYTNELECSEATDIIPLLKMFDLKFADDDKSLCEKLLDYFMSAEQYKGKRLFVTVNLRSYIDDAQAELFFQSVMMRKIKLLCIENCVHKKLNGEKRIIIDNDLCVI